MASRKHGLKCTALNLTKSRSSDKLLFLSSDIDFDYVRQWLYLLDPFLLSLPSSLLALQLALLEIDLIHLPLQVTQQSQLSILELLSFPRNSILEVGHLTHDLIYFYLHHAER